MACEICGDAIEIENHKLCDKCEREEELDEVEEAAAKEESLKRRAWRHVASLGWDGRIPKTVLTCETNEVLELFVSILGTPQFQKQKKLADSGIKTASEVMEARSKKKK